MRPAAASLIASGTGAAMVSAAAHAPGRLTRALSVSTLGLSVSTLGLTLATLALSPSTPLLAQDGPAPVGVAFTSGRLLVDGEPFFPYGVQWLTLTDPATCAAHHFNVVYVGGDLEVLHEVEAAGIKATASAGDLEKVRRLNESPALIAWFLKDDVSQPDDFEHCRRRTAIIRQVDPSRPTFANANGRRLETDLEVVRLVDIYAPYAYPFPRYDLDWYAHDFLDHLRHGVGRPTIWTTVQSSGIYSAHRALGFDDRQMAMMLDPAQLRLLVWTGIAHGARGIFLWPDSGLLDAGGRGQDRLAEAALIGCELEVLGGWIVAADEIPGGVHTDPIDLDRVDAARLDLGTESMILLIRNGPGYQYAVNDAEPLEVTVTVPRSRAGSRRAFAVSFPGLREIPTTGLPDGSIQLHVPDLAPVEMVMLTPDPANLADIESALIARSAEAARWAERGAAAYARKAAWVLDQLARLDALPGDVAAERNALDGTCAAALRLLDGPAPLDAGDDPTRIERDAAARFEWARLLSRRLRGAMARCRDHADTFMHDAPPDAANFRLSPFTLPEFFSSFDLEQVRERRITASPQ